MLFENWKANRFRAGPDLAWSATHFPLQREKIVVKDEPMRIYGPVPSRRFGLSLGIDLVPHKTCSFDCVYCQLGETDRLTITPQRFYPLDDVLRDVEEALDEDPLPDVITLAGSGEPTLFEPLGDLFDGLKALADIPILLITNSSLLWRADVAEAVHKTDILAPSLDAGDPETYRRVNLPHTDVPYDRLIGGLRDMTHAYAGEIRLEVMLIRGINDDEQSLEAIARQLETLRFDQVDINTPVRPPVPERGALPCYADVLERAKNLFGPKAKAIGRFSSAPKGEMRSELSFDDVDKDIREMLLRRPCTLGDISASLHLEREVVTRSLERLTARGLVKSRTNDGGSENGGSDDRGTYFFVPGENPTILPQQ